MLGLPKRDGGWDRGRVAMPDNAFQTYRPGNVSLLREENLDLHTAKRILRLGVEVTALRLQDTVSQMQAYSTSIPRCHQHDGVVRVFLTGRRTRHALVDGWFFVVTRASLVDFPSIPRSAKLIGIRQPRYVCHEQTKRSRGRSATCV